MLSPGTLLSERYELTERIAAGGMGEVWRGTDLMLHRAIAVKVVLPGLMADPEFLTRFRSEARMMAALRHPGIVQVYDYGENATVGGGRMDYMVMEFIEGTPLAKQIQQAGRLSPAETMRIVAQVADALQVAHDAGIVHRDVKPANLLVRPNGALVLVDFGVARSTQVTGITSTNVVLGSANYMAPEQAEGHPVSGLTDVYALGAVAYCCLTGRPPYVGENPLQVLAQLVYGELPPLPPDVPPAVAALVTRALAKNPQHRFPSAAAMAQAARGAGRPGAPAPQQRPGGPGNSGAFPPAGAASGGYPPTGRNPGTGSYPPGRSQTGYGARPAGAAAVGGTAPYPSGTGQYPGGTAQYPGGTAPYPSGGSSYPSGSASVPSSGFAAGAASVSPPSYGSASGAGGSYGSGSGASGSYGSASVSGGGYGNRPPASVVTGGYEGGGSGGSSGGSGSAPATKKRTTVIALAIAAVVLGVVAVTFAIVNQGSGTPDPTGQDTAAGALDPSPGPTGAPAEEEATKPSKKPKPTKTKTTKPADPTTEPAEDETEPAEDETPANGGTNPFTAPQLCGDGYQIIDTATLSGNAGTVGRVYLLQGDEGKNCVVTLRSSDLAEKADASAFLEVQGKNRDSQGGEVDYYAGPVKAAADKTCIIWGGSIDDFSYESKPTHCG
ncbi:serine/threonine-protein kinase [Actinoplanes sp. NPDC049596]|uniref:serine/threonine-protein kinase n=1 Tax=unclassified Actinoplanes TaxID=2626549 RepID=UPI00342C9B03